MTLLLNRITMTKSNPWLGNTREACSPPSAKIVNFGFWIREPRRLRGNANRTRASKIPKWYGLLVLSDESLLPDLAG